MGTAPGTPIPGGGDPGRIGKNGPIPDSRCRVPANRESGIGTREPGGPNPRSPNTGIGPGSDSRFPSDLWVDIVRKVRVRPILARHLRVRVAILRVHRPVLQVGSLGTLEGHAVTMGGGPARWRICIRRTQGNIHRAGSGSMDELGRFKLPLGVFSIGKL